MNSRDLNESFSLRVDVFDGEQHREECKSGKFGQNGGGDLGHDEALVALAL